MQAQTQTTRAKKATPRKAVSSRRPTPRSARTAEELLPNTSKNLENLLRWCSRPNLYDLKEIHNHYVKDVFFKDPLVEIYNINELEQYYARLLNRFSEMRFFVENTAEDGNQAFITWVMTARLLGQDISIRGSSHFKFDASSGLCEYQRDYFDLSEEVYEQVPLLGYIFKGLKMVLN